MNPPNPFQLEAIRKRTAGFQYDANTLEFLNDIVTTAIEGGIGYWSECRNYRWRDVPMTTAEIRDTESDGAPKPDDPWHLLDPYAMEAGIMTILNVSSEMLMLHDINRKIVAGAWAILDGGDIDADAADWIVQAAIFGEVIYG